MERTPNGRQTKESRDDAGIFLPVISKTSLLKKCLITNCYK